MSTNFIDQITDTGNTIQDIAESVSTRIFRATCSTAAATGAKVATLDADTNKNFSLTSGVRVAVTFTYGNTNSAPTLKVNGSSTGTAKSIITTNAKGNSVTIPTWGTYETIIFTYNGTNWIMSTAGAIQGLTSGTESGHIVTWGSDGYTVADSGKSFTTSTPTSSSTDSTIPTSKAVWSAIDGSIKNLDVSNISGFGAGKTLSALSETDGKISATFQDISIAPSQINNTIPVSKGGTGATSFTANSVIISGSSTTSALTTRSITDSSSASAISSTSTSIPTERDIYYGLPTINNAHNYTSSTTIYAPAEGGSSGYYLKGAGTTTAPTWQQPTDSTSASAISTGTALVTERDVYYGLPKINNAHDYTSSTTIYAPTAGGTADTTALVGNGTTTAPKWVSISPSISITAGDSSNAPKINVTVLGQSGTTAQAITTASTSAYGVTKLSSSTSSTSTALAATPSAVKSAYDLANAAMPKTGGSFTGAVDGAATTAATAQFRNIQIGTTAPSGTAPNGTIYMQYKA